jgi:hypothetical protein
MKVKLYTAKKVDDNFGIRLFQGKDSTVVKLWESIEEKKQRINAAIEKEKQLKRSELEKQKIQIVDQRRGIGKLKEKIKEINSLLANNDARKANSELLKLFKDPYLDTFKNMLEYKAALFYLYKQNMLVDKMFEASDGILEKIKFNEDNVKIYYDVAVLNEEFGDATKAAKIFRMFIDAMHFDYEDVVERFKKYQ